MNLILTENNIINTYNKKQQEQSGLYIRYCRIKKENPEFGYKRIARLLGQQYHKTRWWYSKKYMPVPVQTAGWLKKRNLLPLSLNHPKLPIMARILGATFGDGGIFENLNGIFLSSSELESVKEFGEDLKEIFGNDVELNSRIIEGGEYGHSWCYQNTNRKIIRLFKALGAPIGNKTKIELNVPEWIFINQEIADEFFGAFIGGEMGIPKMHVKGTHLNTLDIGICSPPKFRENRHHFLNQLRRYFDAKSIKTGTISQSCNKKDPNTIVFRLLLSTSFENMLNFLTLTKIRYCIYKQKKLINTINEFGKIKKQRYKDLRIRGYSDKTTKKLLNLSEPALYIIDNELPFEEDFLTQPESPLNLSFN